MRPGPAVVLLAAAVVLAGCATAPRSIEEDIGDHVGPFDCRVHLDQERWQPDRYLNLTWQRFEELAPNFAALFLNDTDPLGPPNNLGGPCETFRPEGQAIMQEFNRTRTPADEFAPGAYGFFFKVQHPAVGPVLVKINGPLYGYFSTHPE